VCNVRLCLLPLGDGHGDQRNGLGIDNGWMGRKTGRWEVGLHFFQQNDNRGGREKKVLGSRGDLVFWELM
jgi:hypothetical protein